ncbi:MAG TPA: hypothetical protein VHD90_06750 [Phototrophicaceae bacterium]|nr:hypothetical protein [Phototrophicaceae bacterium]
MSQDPLFKPFKDEPDQPNKPIRPIPQRHLSRTALGCLVIVAAVIGCSVGSFVAGNVVCAAYLPQRLPIYPGATVVFQNHNFLTPFGMGTTSTVLHSSDPPDTVRTWYGRTTGTFLKQSIENNDPLTFLGRQIARVQYDVSDAPEGSGSQIILYTQCLD